MKILGYRSVVAKKNGVRYVELYIGGADKFTVGIRCETVFVREDMIQNLDCMAVDADCTVVYNRFGRVDQVIISI